MKGWLIYNKKGYERNGWFANELIKYLGCRLIIAEELEFGVNNGVYFKYRGEDILPPPYAVQRSVYPILSSTLELGGTRVFNSSRVCEICNDKRKTHLFATRLNIPTLRTAFSAGDFLSSPFLPSVVKGASGHGGNEVFYAEDKAQLEKALSNIKDKGLLFQTMATDVGIDKRVYILGGKVLATVKRQAREGFKSNFSLGGEAFLSDLSPKEKEIADKLVAHLKPDFVGVDFIYNEGEPYLNEVEDIVGTRMLYSLTDINSAKVYAEYILDNI